MGLLDRLKTVASDFREAQAQYEVGCEILGRPRNPNSALERGDRIREGRRELQRRAEEARRQQLEGRWTSRYRSDTGKIDVLLDKSGNPTNVYPHVHVAYNAQEDKVHVILSLGPRDHPAREVLPGDASGNQVNGAVYRMQCRLP